MRGIYLILLVVFVVVVAVFAAQNMQDITVKFVTMRFSAPAALIVAGSYVAGMLSGWWVYDSVRGLFAKARRR